MLHGLGFGSELRQIENMKYLTTKQVQLANTIKQRRMPISIYDSLIHSEKGSIADSGKVFESSPQYFFQPKLEIYSDFMNSVQQLYQIAVSNDVHIKFSDGTSANLKSDGEFLYGRSLSHFSDNYSTTADFLMTLNAKRGETLNSEMLKNNSTSLLGPETKKILAAMGWTVEGSPSPIQLIDILPETFFEFEHQWN